MVCLVISAAAACGSLEPDFDRVVAIEVTAPDSIEQFDTLRPAARALDGRGDPVPTDVYWATLDTALLAVLDTTSGVMVAKQPSATAARIQARVGNLRTNPIAVRVLAAADTLFAAGSTELTVTVSAPDSLSDSLSVELADSTSSGLAGLGGRPVAWAVTDPAGSSAVTLVRDDTAHAPVAADTLATSALGVAAVRVRLIAPPAPDSVVVAATARRAVGTAVPGSPVTFVVRFLP